MRNRPQPVAAIGFGHKSFAFIRLRWIKIARLRHWLALTHCPHPCGSPPRIIFILIHYYSAPLFSNKKATQLIIDISYYLVYYSCPFVH